ncbi:MAG TPA: 50S ribosomal protein L11 methyltransferase [Pseudobacteroides sp.]|uniref:50S ribosomal protein L11 methyltransferase n=1 Tax=Pseudobacteroides sp. TaxID=1968840 RepID=UPI002F92E670
MKWYEIIINTTEEASDAMSEMLTSIGAGGVAIEDPNDIRKELLKPGTLDYADQAFFDNLGEDVKIKAYFSNEKNLNELIGLINEKINFIGNFLDTGKGYMGYNEVDDEDWATSWKKYYKPIKIAERVVIKPSWEQYEESGGDIVIELDPGMAFGTGTHETTMMCAQLLEKYLKDGDSILDLGCGTGILSIIAYKLGAKDIKAVDIDEVAVKVATDNCKLNNADKGIEVLKGVLGDVLPFKYDVVIANIIASVIVDISESMPYYVNKEGYFLTSGIIKERKQEVLDAYASKGFKAVEILEMGEWVAIAFKCQGSL